MQKQRIGKIARLNQRGARKCIWINSLIFRHFSVGERAPKPRYVPVLTLPRKQCYGSKKWRWSIRWKFLSHRDQVENIISRILRCSMRRLRLIWRSSSLIRTSRRESVWRSKGADARPISSRKTDSFYDLRILPSDWSTWSWSWLHRFIECLCARWRCSRFLIQDGSNSVIYRSSSQRQYSRKFEEYANARGCATSTRVDYVRTRNRSRSIEAEFAEVEDNGKKTFRSNDQSTKLLRPETKELRQEYWSRVRKGKQKDGFWMEMLAVSVTGPIVERQRNRPPVLQERRLKEDLRNEKGPVGAVHLERKDKDRARIAWKETVRIRCVIIGILPYVKITNLNRDAHSAKSAHSSTLRRTDGPVKSRRKVTEKDR